MWWKIDIWVVLAVNFFFITLRIIRLNFLMKFNNEIIYLYNISIIIVKIITSLLLERNFFLFVITFFGSNTKDCRNQFTCISISLFWTILGAQSPASTWYIDELYTRRMLSQRFQFQLCVPFGYYFVLLCTRCSKW